MLKLALPEPDLDRDPDFECELPWAPSINNYYRQGIILPAVEKVQERIREHGWSDFFPWLRKQVRTSTFLSKAGKNYREACGFLLVRQLRAQGGGVGTSRVAMEVVLHPPTSRAHDIDNFNKAIFDALEHVHVFENDAQIHQLLETKGHPISSGRVEVRIWKIPG